MDVATIHQLEMLRAAMAEQARREMLASPRYRDEPKRLNHHERQSFSQNEEDGIIAEIFRRVGTHDRFFVEIGVGDGTENNTVALLMEGWSGVWVDADPAGAARIREQFGAYLASGQLRLVHTRVTAENVEPVLQEAGVPAEFDLLSIDIDGNDYWVWDAVKRFRPRAVVMEYNAHFPPSARWVRAYDPDGQWDGTTYFGASLKSLELLGAAKGYRLVGCDLTGVNAFFVRDELCEDRFAAPYTAEHHHEPPRFFLMRKLGHRRRFGPAEHV